MKRRRIIGSNKDTSLNSLLLSLKIDEALLTSWEQKSITALTCKMTNKYVITQCLLIESPYNKIEKINKVTRTK